MAQFGTLDEERTFSRQLLLAEVDDAALQRLRHAEVLVVGAGGLGCPAAQYLAAAGVGRLRWVDGDTVDASNLPRQILFGPQDVGRPKVLAGQASLADRAPFCTILAEAEHGHAENLPGWIAQANVVLDCTDRFETRQLINRLCVAAHKPLVIASVIQWSGQLLVVDPRAPQAGCYACLFEPGLQGADAACGAFGVFSTAAGMVGLMQAHEALQLLMGLPVQAGELRLIDAKRLEISRVTVPRHPGCSVCATSHQQPSP